MILKKKKLSFDICALTYIGFSYRFKTTNILNILFLNKGEQMLRRRL